jgi:type II secretory pathway pseudopilin PulG
MEFWKSQQGLSILDVVVAVAVMAMAGGAAATLVGVTVVEQTAADRTAQAERLLREGLEAARSIRDANFPSLSEGSHGLSWSGSDWSFSGSSDTTDGVFTRTVTISAVSGDPDQKEVVVSVTWQERGERERALTASTRLSDWRLAILPPPLP